MNRPANALRIGFLGLPVAVLLLSLTAGCQNFGWQKEWKNPFHISKNMPWPIRREKPTKTPQRLATFWNDTILSKPGETAQRGFGGRVYFYEREGEEPVPVDGQLVVYAFDESNRSPDDNRPTRKYIFPADQLAKHFSESELGPSYSVWLPWDNADGDQKQISLIARFEPKSGATIVGQQARQQLPGKPPADMMATQDRPQLASYQDTVQPTGPDTVQPLETPTPADPPTDQAIPRNRMTTTSIALPPHVGLGRPRPYSDSKTDPKPQPAPSATAPTSHTLPRTSIQNDTGRQVSSYDPNSPPPGFQLAKRLAPEGRVSPPTVFRNPN